MFGKNLVLGVVAFCGSLCHKAKHAAGKVVVAAVAAVTAVSNFAAEVRADVTLPTTGVDVADYIEAAIATLGTVAAAAIGGYVAYTALKRGIRWIRTAMT